MNFPGVKFKNYRCFSSDWVGFDEIKPINIIIGKNNHGKSCLLDLLEQLTKLNFYTEDSTIKYRFTDLLNLDDLKNKFSSDVSGGELRGNHWQEHGKHFLNEKVNWERHENKIIINISFEDSFNYSSEYGNRSTEERLRLIKEILVSKRHWMSSYRFHRLVADRDIVPEIAELAIDLFKNGAGATNIARRFITSADKIFNRDLIQKEILSALNRIFGEDAFFNEFQVKVHDETGDDKHKWEIYLGEQSKGLIKLSESGSGLKTVILVLLNIFLFPYLEKRKESKFIFAFEEIENNLHPSLFKRLLMFLEEIALKKGYIFFLTTHSNIVLDFFGSTPNAQIIHIKHNGEFALSSTISTYFDQLKILTDLGVKTSDLLLANCIVWVEGPSDRIYVNKWIEIFSEGKIREGRHYQCAFYGGSLLAHDQFASPEDFKNQFANLLMINSKNILIADGDRTSSNGKGSSLKPRLIKIKEQIENIPDESGFIWITEAKEIENYIPAFALENVFRKTNLPEIGKFEIFSYISKIKSQKPGYIQNKIKISNIDKIDLAMKVVPFLNQDLLSKRFELKDKMTKICDIMKKWNNIN